MKKRSLLPSGTPSGSQPKKQNILEELQKKIHNLEGEIQFLNNNNQQLEEQLNRCSRNNNELNRELEHNKTDLKDCHDKLNELSQSKNNSQTTPSQEQQTSEMSAETEQVRKTIPDIKFNLETIILAQKIHNFIKNIYEEYFGNDNLSELLKMITREGIHKDLYNRIIQNIFTQSGQNLPQDIVSKSTYTLNYLNQMFYDDLEYIIDINKVFSINTRDFYIDKESYYGDINSLKVYYENIIKRLEVIILEKYLVILHKLNLDTQDINKDLINQLCEEDGECQTSNQPNTTNTTNICKLIKIIKKLLIRLKLILGIKGGQKSNNNDISYKSINPFIFTKQFNIISLIITKLVNQTTTDLIKQTILVQLNQSDILYDRLQKIVSQFIKIRCYYVFYRSFNTIIGKKLLKKTDNMKMGGNVNEFVNKFNDKNNYPNLLKTIGQLQLDNRCCELTKLQNTFEFVLTNINSQLHQNYILLYLVNSNQQVISLEFLLNYFDLFKYDDKQIEIELYNINTNSMTNNGSGSPRRNTSSLGVEQATSPTPMIAAGGVIKIMNKDLIKGGNKTNLFDLDTDKIIYKITYENLEDLLDDLDVSCNLHSNTIIYNGLHKYVFTKLEQQNLVGIIEFLNQHNSNDENNETKLNNIKNTFCFSKYYNEQYLLNNSRITSADRFNDYISRREYIFSGNTTDYKDSYERYLRRYNLVNNPPNQNQVINPTNTRQFYNFPEIQETTQPGRLQQNAVQMSGGRIQFDNNNCLMSLYTPIDKQNSSYDFYSIVLQYFINIPNISRGFLAQFTPDKYNRNNFIRDWHSILQINSNMSTEIQYNNQVRIFINSIPFNYLIMLTDLAHDFLGGDRAKIENKWLLTKDNLLQIGFMYNNFLPFKDNIPKYNLFFKKLIDYTKVGLNSVTDEFVKKEFSWVNNKNEHFWLQNLFKKSSSLGSDKEYKLIMLQISKLLSHRTQKYLTGFDYTPLTYSVHPSISKEDIDFRCIRGSRDINMLNSRNCKNENVFSKSMVINNYYQSKPDLRQTNELNKLQPNPKYSFYVTLKNEHINEILTNMYTTQSINIANGVTLLHPTSNFLCIDYGNNNERGFTNYLTYDANKLYHIDCLLTTQGITIENMFIDANKRLIPIYNMVNGPNTIDPYTDNKNKLVSSKGHTTDYIYDLSLSQITLIPDHKIIFYVCRYISGFNDATTIYDDNRFFDVMNLRQAITFSQDCFRNNRCVLAYLMTNYNGHQFGGYCILGFNQTYKKAIVYNDNNVVKIIKQSKFNRHITNDGDYFRVDYLYIKYYVNDNEYVLDGDNLFTNGGRNSNERGLVCINTRNTSLGVKDISIAINNDLYAGDVDEYKKYFITSSISEQYKSSLTIPITGGNYITGGSTYYNTNNVLGGTYIQGIKFVNVLNGSIKDKFDGGVANDNHFTNGNTLYDYYEFNNVYYQTQDLNGVTYHNPKVLNLFSGVYDNHLTGHTFDYIKDIHSIKDILFQFISFSLFFKTWGDLSNVLTPFIILSLIQTPNYWQRFRQMYNIQDVDNNKKKLLLQFLSNINVNTGDDTTAILMSNILSGLSGVRVGSETTDFSMIHLNRYYENRLSKNKDNITINNYRNELFGFTGGNTITNKLSFFEDSLIKNYTGRPFLRGMTYLFDQGITNSDFDIRNRYILPNVGYTYDITINGNTNNAVNNHDLYNKLVGQTIMVDTFNNNIKKKYNEYFNHVINSASYTSWNNLLNGETSYKYEHKVPLNRKMINGETKQGTTYVKEILKYYYEDIDKICGITITKGIQERIKENTFNLIKLNNLYMNDSNGDKLTINNITKSGLFNIKDDSSSYTFTGHSFTFLSRTKGGGDTSFILGTSFGKQEFTDFQLDGELIFTNNGATSRGYTSVYQTYRFNR